MDQLHTDIDPSKSTNCFYAADAQAQIMPDFQIINIWDNALYVGARFPIAARRRYEITLHFIQHTDPVKL